MIAMFCNSFVCTAATHQDHRQTSPSYQDWTSLTSRRWDNKKLLQEAS
jgi:hypothetical protein